MGYKLKYTQVYFKESHLHVIRHIRPMKQTKNLKHELMLSNCWGIPLHFK